MEIVRTLEFVIETSFSCIYNVPYIFNVHCPTGRKFSLEFEFAISLIFSEISMIVYMIESQASNFADIYLREFGHSEPGS